MAGQLRYELIGDASEFQSAAQTVASASELIETNIDELQANIESVTASQIQWNESAERFGDATGQFQAATGEFVSAAEAQTAVLRELNALGIKTEAQYERQMQQLSDLANVVEEGSLAHQQLMRQQEMLQQEMLQTAEASEQAGGGFSMAMGPANDLGFLLQDLQTFSIDATMGFRSISNNIPGVVMSTQQMIQSGASLTTMLTGAGGFILAVNAAAAALPMLTQALSGTDEEAQNAADSIFKLSNRMREGLPVTRQFAAESVERLEQMVAVLEEARQKTQFAQFAAPGQVGISQGIQAGTMERLQSLQQERQLNEDALNLLEERVDKRAAQNRVLEVQRQVIQDTTSLTTAQAQNLQEQDASLTTILEALQQGVITHEQASELTSSQVDSARRLVDNQRVFNELLDRGVLSQEEYVNHVLSSTQGLETINQLEARLNAAVERGNVSRQRAAELYADMAEEIAGMEPPPAPEVPDMIIDAESMFPERAAQRRQREAAQAAIEALPDLEMPESAFEQTEDQFDQLASQLGRAVKANRLGFDETGAEIGKQLIENARRAFIRGDISADEFQQFREAGKEAGAEIEQGVNRNLARGIQLAAQLGTTMVQAAQQGGAEWNQVLGSVLTTIGSIVGTANPAAGAAVAGTGQLIGSFGEGGPVRGPGGPRDDMIPARLSDGEFVVNAASAQAAMGALQAMNEDPRMAQAIEAMVSGPEMRDGGIVGRGASRPSAREPMAPRPQEVRMRHEFDFSLDRVGPGQLALVVREAQSFYDDTHHNG